MKSKTKLSQLIQIHSHGLTKALVLTLVLVLLIAAGRYTPNVVINTSTFNERQIPIYCVSREDKKIALTFDAAWGNEDTKTLLQILKKQEVKATFFVTGGWADAYPEDLKAIFEEGHEIGNHSQTHPKMTEISKEKIKEEIMSVHEKVKQITGQDMTLFRPPYGDYNNLVIETAKSCGYYSIQWDVDSQDWRDYGIESIIQMVTQNESLKGGSIILMHNGAKYTKDALEAVIISLKEKGYEFVTVSELIYHDAYHIDHTGKQIAD